jgi:hypothetical protein
MRVFGVLGLHVKRMLVASACALLAFSRAGYADDSFHCPKPGTVIAFNNSGGLTITGQTGLICEAKTSGGARLRRFLGLVDPGSPLVENHAEQLFPLKIGNEIEFTTVMSSSHLTGESVTSMTTAYVMNTVKVARQEKLVTAGGTFETYVIEYHRLAKGHWLGAWMTTYWFAPELGYAVKEKNETRMGGGSEGQFEVTSITYGTSPTIAAPPAPAPPAPRAAPVEPPAAKPPAAIAPAPPSPAVAARLRSLDDLLAEKLITRAEYAAKRKAILDGD